MTLHELQTLLTDSELQFWDALWLPVAVAGFYIAAWINEKRSFKRWK